jgi:hypothetical protein
MVCRRADGEWGGEVLSVGDGEEGEELGGGECGSVEFVRWVRAQKGGKGGWEGGNWEGGG